MSKMAQFSEFLENHKGEEFTLTGLARGLGWSKKRGKNFNTKAVKRVASKFGVEIKKVSEEGEPTAYLLKLQKKGKS